MVIIAPLITNTNYIQHVDDRDMSEGKDPDKQLRIAHTSDGKDSNTQFKVGRGSIRLEDIDLIGLRHISSDSWQALFRLRSPSIPDPLTLEGTPARIANAHSQAALAQHSSVAEQEDSERESSDDEAHSYSHSTSD